jgi:hypothetical protein
MSGHVSRRSRPSNAPTGGCSRTYRVASIDSVKASARRYHYPRRHWVPVEQLLVLDGRSREGPADLRARALDRLRGVFELGVTQAQRA